MRTGEVDLVEAMEAAPLYLGTLRNGMIGLSQSWGGVLAEAAAVCLEDRKHSVRTLLQGTGLFEKTRYVVWDATDEQCRLSHADMQEATEHGACGIAILLAHECTGQEVVQRSKKGTGFDYWLGGSEQLEDQLPFSSNQTRLEVSGILSGTAAQVSTRVKAKKKQMDPSDDLGRGMVAVVEFGTPRAVLENK